jgi:SAM-dependent methyltransferase
VDPTESTRSTYEAIADAYHERTGDDETLVPALDRFVGRLPPEPRVLDAGCGPGRDASRLRARGADVVAIDFADAQLRLAAEHAPGTAPVRGDLRALPVTTDAVDGVWCAAALLHVERDAVSGVLRGFQRVLRPGGVLFVSTPQGEGTDHSYAYGTDTGRHVVLYTAAALRDRLTDSGFRLVDGVTADDGWLRAVATTEASGV